MKIIMILLSFLLLISTVGFAQDTIILYGTINDEENLVTDTGKEYEFVENPKSDELTLFKGKRVEVKGKTVQIDGRDVFMIFEFSSVKKKPVQPSN